MPTLPGLFIKLPLSQEWERAGVLRMDVLMSREHPKGTLSLRSGAQGCVKRRGLINQDLKETPFLTPHPRIQSGAGSNLLPLKGRRDYVGQQ